MRIVIQSRYPLDESAPRGGVETATQNLVSGLSKVDGNEIHVVTIEAGRRERRVESRGKITIHRLPGNGWPSLIDVFYGPGKRKLFEYIDRIGPEIVHFHETYGLDPRGRRWPAVFTVHGFDSLNIPVEETWSPWLRSLIWRAAEKRGLGKQKYLISIARYVRNEIERRTTAKIFDINNALSEAGFNVQRRDEGPVVFYAGWINPRKNALGLIRAFRYVINSMPEAMLRMAGEFSDAEYRAKVDREIEDRGLEDNVHLLGRLPAQGIREELEVASVFALTSFQENAPMVVAEALAAGVPVVTSNRCGMPYMVEHGKTGLLVEPDDHESVAGHLLEILRSQTVRAEMSENAKNFAALAYHPDAVANETMRVYAEVMKNFPVANSNTQSAYET
jgi:glycosyltransferase involved in cell wall biosynthesis